MIFNPLLKNGLQQVEDPTTYTNNVIQTVFSIFFLVASVYFIWHFIMAGYHLISTEGDPKKLTVAKDQITFALIGIVVIFGVFAVLKLVGTVLGVTGLENLQITWPTL
ncbi:MAG: hypothetical protein US68_C0004G0027 [Candidatus Shapirobacteria bacterium GW2011_GWE1_38_10]|uniref:Uncharacterized protein n=1 Tax=Candidatus Shapirobacteria bacterium GW2011_GWE1_38_10 TaxID=1618488 RepID=A0A0G0IHP3_9BACT|nr:MAG: hypothetical protein US46_C0005G0043 [Candidatus Shapirobacteria bacterium GW2011_GWF2_37_20]KKQ50545.1 MAG: hypothetical protein US68_C0004G0027 [Candidatus Shapirobacteria bacterium GW2011_GWE1_38_10]KKQ64687.1 MAG: hypothetical protein US85_C0005G0035 [Candidatus Shapirobacteria bacterium GW2011_GWF1_38_23]HBP51112.1 hypothetical protein [Candidatus Shapirobacteria bacterium]